MYRLLHQIVIGPLQAFHVHGRSHRQYDLVLAMDEGVWLIQIVALKPDLLHREKLIDREETLFLTEPKPVKAHRKTLPHVHLQQRLTLLLEVLFP